jgi:hypothetical protein
MRALAPALAIFAAGCAGNTSADLQPLSTPEVCYVGMVKPEYRQLAYEEVARRETSCERYTADIRAIDQALRQRAAQREAEGGRLADLDIPPAGLSSQPRGGRRGR